jgi:hypothetical protein
MSSYDNQVIEALADRIASGDVDVIMDQGPCFKMLQSLLRIPSVYSDIYEIPGVIVSDLCNPEDPAHEYIAFLAAHTGLSEYLYCGDGLTEYAYHIRSGIDAFVTAISSVPQHHYFMALDKSLVVYFAFENCMVFVDTERVIVSQ